MLKKIMLFATAWCLLVPSTNLSMREPMDLTDDPSDDSFDNQRTTTATKKNIWQRIRSAFTPDERSKRENLSEPDNSDEEEEMPLTNNLRDQLARTKAAQNAPEQISSKEIVTDEILKSHMLAKRNTKEQNDVLTLLAPIARALPDNSSYSNSLVNLGNRISTISPYASSETFQEVYTTLMQELKSLLSSKNVLRAQKPAINEALTFLNRISTGRLRINS